MNLSLFFDPVHYQLIEQATHPNSFAKNIVINSEGKIPELSHGQIALIGIIETAGFGQFASDGQHADTIRAALYTLRKGPKPYNIIDLGNLRRGIDYSESLKRLSEVIQFLVDFQIIPVVIGASHDFLQPILDAIDLKGLCVANIDARIDEDVTQADNPHRNFLSRVDQFRNIKGFQINHLAYQSYLTDQPEIELFGSKGVEFIRLGMIRQDPLEVEPILRDADVLSFDLGSIKYQDQPGHFYPVPFGLTAEEACQLAWITGHSYKIKAAGFFDYCVDNDPSFQGAFVVATTLWYFLEALTNRSALIVLGDDNFLYYDIPFQHEPKVITFIKEITTGKWWLKFPLDNDKGYWLPCTFNDYETALKGEVPACYIKTLLRFQ